MCSVAHKWGPVDRALAGPGSSLPLHSGRTFLRMPRFGRGRFNETLSQGQLRCGLSLPLLQQLVSVLFVL